MISDLINLESSILKNSIYDIGKYRNIYNRNNIYFDAPIVKLFQDYYYYLKINSEYMYLDQKYYNKPELLSYDKYGTVKLWEMLLYINDCFCIEDFTMNKIYIPFYDSVFEMIKNYIKINDKIKNIDNIKINDLLINIDINDILTISLNSTISDTVPSIVNFIKGQPWQQQYDFNLIYNENTLPIISFTNSINMSLPLTDFSVGVTHNKLFVMGGQTINNLLNKYICMCNVDSNGSLLGFNKISNTELQYPMKNFNVLLINNKLHIMGGQINPEEYVPDCTSYELNSNGEIISLNNSWKYEDSFELPIAENKIIHVDGRLYSIGGIINNEVSNKVYCTFADDNGEIDRWDIIKDSPQLPYYVTGHSVIVTKDRVYILGGKDEYGNYLNKIYSCFIDEYGNLSNWAIYGYLPERLAYFDLIVTHNYVFIFGGINNDGYKDSIYYSFINDSCVLTQWKKHLTVLPKKLAHHKCAQIKNKLYILGGQTTDDVYSNSIYVTDFNCNLTTYLQ